MQVVKRDGSRESFDFSKIERLNEYATQGLNVDKELLKSQIRFMVYDGMKTSEIFDAQIKAASGLISLDNPDFTFVAARYLLADLYKRVTGTAFYGSMYDMLEMGIDDGRYNKQLYNPKKFDLSSLEAALDPARDFQFDYFGLQNVVDRYLMRTTDGVIIELPQQFFMRVAMGLALNEDNPTARAIEFYNTLSSFDMLSSTPTLFNSGTIRSQLSSCYLNTVADQIHEETDEPQFASIFGTITESARLSKFAGGIGTDWTRVRGAGSVIKGTNGRSSGVIPYLKVYNDTAVAVNQGGKRKGSFAPYLEPWHPDFWDYCELKKEFGDDRLRAHDIFPAAWLPDLFMKRVEEGGDWSEFQPHLYPELHELFGMAFEVRYIELEQQGKAYRTRKATDVWRRILTCLFETGHPWITFKDECNRRNPQSHVGVVHNSNLCTEITLNTSDTETAVCNLASVNLAKHMKDGQIDAAKLERTVRTTMRMLDNVIDLNYYPSDRAKTSNMKHRPVGLGMMGYAEALVAAGLAFDTQEAVDWGSMVTELWSYYAIEASSDLAVERGAYETFNGSKWSAGVLPIHTAHAADCRLGDKWNDLSEKVKRQGMRNSNVMAIAPTATISILAGTEPSIEPIFELERVEGNMSAKFKVISPCLRYGRPELCKTAFEIEPHWVLYHAAARQTWIDQSQSVNVFVKQGTKGKDLAEIYMLAWRKKLKTTYYLRSQSKTTPVAALPGQMLAKDLKGVAVAQQADDIAGALCSIDNPDCESCQ